MNASLPDLNPHNTSLSAQLSLDFQVFVALFTINCAVHGAVAADESLWLQQYKFPHKYELTNISKES